MRLPYRSTANNNQVDRTHTHTHSRTVQSIYLCLNLVHKQFTCDACVWIRYLLIFRPHSFIVHLLQFGRYYHSHLFRSRQHMYTHSPYICSACSTSILWLTHSICNSICKHTLRRDCAKGRAQTRSGKVRKSCIEKLNGIFDVGELLPTEKFHVF